MSSNIIRHGSLFSGIGGFDLASEWMGWDNVFHCELNEFGQRVLKYYWPNAESFTDITKTDFTKYANKIDILTGGFPCQPYSMAGKRLGKEDDRHLWPEMLRAIREISPRYIVGENVPGLVNWDGGLVFEEVQADLEAQGYEVVPVILPACSQDAPHRRERIWFVAHAIGLRNSSSGEGGEVEKRGKNLIEAKRKRRSRSKWVNGLAGFSRNATDSTGKRLRGKSNRIGESGFSYEKSKGNEWENFPTQSPVCSGDDGLSYKLDGITFPKWRSESIKGFGNAIVPQIAYQIFKVINEFMSNYERPRNFKTSK